MGENQTVPAMIPEGDFAAFLEGEKVETRCRRWGMLIVPRARTPTSA